MTKRERLQIQYQLQHHAETDIYEMDLPLTHDNHLKNFIMYPGVLKPMSSLALTHYLCENPKLYNNKVVIDMGSGSGIQGVATALNGAKKVIFSDIDINAYHNTFANVIRFCPRMKSFVTQGDLFENIDESADLIVFAQPYFPGKPIREHPVTRAMLDPGVLIQRFLTEVKRYSHGPILMPFLDWISEPNNPKIQAAKYGFKVTEVYRQNLQTGIQKGVVSIYELTI